MPENDDNLFAEKPDIDLACRWWKDHDEAYITDFIFKLPGNPGWHQFMACFKLYGRFVLKELNNLKAYVKEIDSVLLKDRCAELSYTLNPKGYNAVYNMVSAIQSHRPSQENSSLVPPPGYAFVSSFPSCLHATKNLKRQCEGFESSSAKRIDLDI